MTNLFVYHEGTGTVLPLSDKVYLCNVDDIDPIEYADIVEGASVGVKLHKGVRIDNYNMAKLFMWGGE